MKVRITSIQVSTDYKDGKRVELPDLRSIEATVVDAHESRQNYQLPAAEVDGLINVGSVYELIFARREK